MTGGGRLGSVLLVAVAWAVAPAAAEAPLYRYLEGGFLYVDPGSATLDSGDGWFAGGAWGGGHFEVFGEQAEEEADLDFGAPDVRGTFERTTRVLGLGWHGFLGESADLLVRGGWADVDFRQVVVVDPFEPTVMRGGTDGRRWTAGVRWRVRRELEVEGSWVKLDLDGDAGEDGFELGATGYLGWLGFGARFTRLDASGDRVRLYLRLCAGP